VYLVYDICPLPGAKIRKLDRERKTIKKYLREIKEQRKA